MTKTFEWNAETTAKVVNLYADAVETNGVEVANKSLDDLAKQIGAKSGASVRSKLTSEKAYQKSAKGRKVGGSTAVPKMSYIRALQAVAASKGVDLNARKLESLESATVADIKDIINLVETVTGEAVKIAGIEQAEEAKAPKQETAKA